MSLRRFPEISFVRDREQFLIGCARDKRVLHLGCADAIHFEEHAEHGRLLHALLGGVAKSLIGVDLDPHGIARLRNHLDKAQLHVANVEELTLDFGTDFDLIIAGELIEHLNNPGRFLESMRRYMGSQTDLIITTPNVLSLKVLLHSFAGRQRMHPDHSLGFGCSLLETLVERHGLFVSTWFSSVERFGSGRNALANPLFSVVFSALPRYADTLIAVVRKKPAKPCPDSNEPPT